MFASIAFGTDTVPQACFVAGSECIDVPDSVCRMHDGISMGEGSDCKTAICPPILWSQPLKYESDTSTGEFWGWAQPSIYGEGIVADDFRGIDGSPITDIHFWGGHENWCVDFPPVLDQPLAFHIGIWTACPGGSEYPPCFPETLVKEWIVPLGQLNQHIVGEAALPVMPVAPETTFAYEFNIPQTDWFYPDAREGSYWISIAAMYDQEPRFPWGWTTRQHVLDTVDPPLTIMEPADPTIGCTCTSADLIEPVAGGEWDLSYVLFTAGMKGDCDYDNDVDLVDFGAFQLCFGSPVSMPECRMMDFDADFDVDLRDFGYFQMVFTGGTP